MMTVLANQSLAIDFVIDFVRLKYGCWYQKIGYQNGRHFHLKPSDDEMPSFYVVFKREWFVTFSKIFSEFVVREPLFCRLGVGESLNEEALFRSIRLKVDYLCFVHPDSSVFVISPLGFYKFAKKYDLFRQQKRTNWYKKADESCELKSVNEVTFSVPKDLLIRLYREGC